MRKFIYQIAILIVLLYSIFGIYQQLSLLLNAKNEIYQAEIRNNLLINRNNELKKAIGL